MFNKDFVNLSYILGYKIQNELFTLLHPSRSNNLMCGMLEKQHYTVGMKAYSKFKHKIASNFFHSYLYEKMLYDKMFISQLQNKKEAIQVVDILVGIKVRSMVKLPKNNLDISG